MLAHRTIITEDSSQTPKIIYHYKEARNKFIKFFIVTEMVEEIKSYELVVPENTIFKEFNVR